MAVAVAVLVGLRPALAAPRPGPGPCREAANGLVSLLDAKMDNTALYRESYAVVVNTCGPVAPLPKPKNPPPSRAGCHDLATAMVDLIEDDKMNTAAFVKARNAFAEACAPL